MKVSKVQVSEFIVIQTISHKHTGPVAHWEYIAADDMWRVEFISQNPLISGNVLLVPGKQVQFIKVHREVTGTP